MKVALIGNLAGVGYTTAKALRQIGVGAHLYIFGSSKGMELPSWEDEEVSQCMPDWIHIWAQAEQHPSKGLWKKIKTSLVREISYFRTSWELLRKYDLLHSFTGTLFGLRWPIIFCGIFRLEPYIACATGSDLREVAALYDNARGKLMRLFFKRANLTLLLNFDLVSLVERLNLKRSIFFPFLIDTDRYSPKAVENPYRKSGDELFFLHPSHLDWGIKDPGINRNSTKGNDRFIRAFAHFINEGGNGKVIMLYRGPDRELAKDMVQELGLQERIIWKNTLTKRELINHYNMVDVIADQFDAGSFGTTALEAMACAKPLMIYAKEECAKICYPELPPVVNCRSEKEIYQGIIKLRDSNFREKLAIEGRKWVVKNHSKEVVLKKLLEIYNEICPSTDKGANVKN